MITEYGRLYGSLVLVGKRALSEDNNPDYLPVVPEKYKGEAAEYVDYIASHGGEDKEPTLTDRVATLESNYNDLNDALLEMMFSSGETL